MDHYREMDEISRDILREIGNVGAGNAVTSLAQMMEQPVELEVPVLRIMGYQDVYDLSLIHI